MYRKATPAPRATPTPIWREQLRAVDGPYPMDCWTCEIRSVEEGLVAVAVGRDHTEAESRAVIAVTAVNAHARLVEALRDVAKAGARFNGCNGTTSDLLAACDRARALLAEIGGQS